MEKINVFLTLVMSSWVGGLVLFLVARRGRNLQKFRERQLMRMDLYRFTVAILFAFAWYLVAIDRSWMQGVPDSVLLVLMTALPTLVLCLVSGRWYVGYVAAVVMQAFVVGHWSGVGVQVEGMVVWVGQVGMDVVGVVVYGAVRVGRKAEEKEKYVQESLVRFRLKRDGKEAGHGV